MEHSIKTLATGATAAVPQTEMTVRAIILQPSDWVPNNPSLPVLIYQHALAIDGDVAAAFEDRFQRHGWEGVWRNGVFDYQHYHTGAHEVLGVASGRARLLIGGPDGIELSVHAGDCLVLPAGTGHKRMDASRDFVVVGAYPPDQHADIQTDAASDAQIQKIADLPLPITDPVTGGEGPLLRHWRPV